MELTLLSRVLLVKLGKKFVFYAVWRFIRCLQETTTCSYPVPNESTPHFYAPVSLRYVLILQHACRYSSGLFPSCFLRKFYVHFLWLNACLMAIPSHSPWFDNFSSICDKYKWWISWLFNFLCHVTYRYSQIPWVFTFMYDYYNILDFIVCSTVLSTYQILCLQIVVSVVNYEVEIIWKEACIWGCCNRICL